MCRGGIEERVRAGRIWWLWGGVTHGWKRVNLLYSFVFLLVLEATALKPTSGIYTCALQKFPEMWTLVWG